MLLNEINQSGKLNPAHCYLRAPFMWSQIGPNIIRIFNRLFFQNWNELQRKIAEIQSMHLRLLASAIRIIGPVLKQLIPHTWIRIQEKLRLSWNLSNHDVSCCDHSKSPWIMNWMEDWLNTKSTFNHMFLLCISISWLCVTNMIMLSWMLILRCF